MPRKEEYATTCKERSIVGAKTGPKNGSRSGICLVGQTLTGQEPQ